MMDSAHRGLLSTGRDARQRRQTVREDPASLSTYLPLTAAASAECSEEEGNFPPPPPPGDGETRCQHLMHSMEQRQVVWNVHWYGTDVVCFAGESGGLSGG